MTMLEPYENWPEHPPTSKRDLGHEPREWTRDDGEPVASQDTVSPHDAGFVPPAADASAEGATGSSAVSGDSSHGPLAEVTDDLHDVANARPSVMWSIIIAIAVLFVTLVLGAVLFGGNKDVASGSEVTFEGYTFTIPQDWEYEEGSRIDDDQTRTMVLHNGDSDEVRFMIIDKSDVDSDFINTGQICEAAGYNFNDLHSDNSDLETSGSLVEGHDGCAYKLVGTFSSKMLFLDGVTGDTDGSMLTIVVDDDDKDRIVYLSGLHINDTQFVNGQVEQSILDQIRPQITA